MGDDEKFPTQFDTFEKTGLFRGEGKFTVGVVAVAATLDAIGSSIDNVPTERFGIVFSIGVALLIGRRIFDSMAGASQVMLENRANETEPTDTF